MKTIEKYKTKKEETKAKRQNAKIDLKTNKVTVFTNNEDGVAKYLEKMLLEEK